MKRWIAPLAVTAALFASTAAAAPPQNIDVTFEWPCPDFDATLHVTGKSGFISVPGGFKLIAPDQTVTITGPTGETVSYVITGVTHVEVLSDGSLDVTATGLNVVLVPDVKKKHPAGLFLTTGTVSWTLNPDFSEKTLFTSEGGTVTDVCELIAP
ncbi:hypothetical protein [Sinomonas mesophila]|uniref:hypothetical protein n=1 Tax=Sinomonas mesophila TaxID=1531955 RepID=UPI00158ED356|nr:hypothetical protein [Sinomonas mesophila]